MHVRLHDSLSRYQIPSLLMSGHQPEYSRYNVAGTIVGFWTPVIFHGVSVARLPSALHFRRFDLRWDISWTCHQGGIIEVGAVDQLDQRFPVQDRQYLFAKFNVEKR